MKIAKNHGLLILMLGLSSVSLCVAQEAGSTTKGKADIRTITGCLSKGDSAKAFVLTAEDGSTWDVKSSAVALAGHVGHTVEATGVVSNPMMHNLKEDAKDAARDAGMKKSNTEHGSLKVTNLKMVSDSCK